MLEVPLAYKKKSHLNYRRKEFPKLQTVMLMTMSETDKKA